MYIVIWCILPRNCRLHINCNCVMCNNEFEIFSRQRQQMHPTRKLHYHYASVSVSECGFRFALFLHTSMYCVVCYYIQNSMQFGRWRILDDHVRCRCVRFDILPQSSLVLLIVVVPMKSTETRYSKE